MRLVSQEEFDKAKSRDLIYIYCDDCNTPFSTPKHDTMSKEKRGTKKRYCSNRCRNRGQGRPINSCLVCGKETKTKFCSQSCAGTFNSIGRYRLPRYACMECGGSTPNHKFCGRTCQKIFENREYLEKWKNGEIQGYSGSRAQVSPTIRKYLLEKYDNKCARCGWCEINSTTGKIPVQVEHIDGNFWNCKEDNLIILCPNCHSLTSTYMALNKGRGRGRFGLRKD